MINPRSFVLAITMGAGAACGGSAPAASSPPQQTPQTTGSETAAQPAAEQPAAEQTEALDDCAMTRAGCPHEGESTHKRLRRR